MSAPDERPSGEIVLNAPLVRALMWGAGYRYDRELAAAIGVSGTRLSRALAGESPPSRRMIDGIARRFPVVPYARLMVRPGEQDPPEAYGLTAADVAGVQE